MKHRQCRPTHPGELLREDVLPHLEITPGRLAELLHVSRQTINEIVTEKRSVSMDMAYRLGRLFRMDPSTWIRIEEAVDRWNTFQAHRQEYDNIHPLAVGKKNGGRLRFNPD